MNSCVLMAQVVRDPELRSTQEGTSIASMMVEFLSNKEGEAPGTLKIDGWGNLAEEMKNSYHVGDSIVIEGRLSMNSYEMPEGYKEKRATLVASRIYRVGGAVPSNVNPVATSQPTYPTPIESAGSPSNVVDFASTLQSQPTPATVSTTTPATSETPSDSENNEDWDRIPF